MGKVLPKSVVLLGVGGGVAAYKAVQVASSISQKGFRTHVAMTPAAQRFITPLTFSAVTNRSVLTKLFPTGYDPEEFEDIYPHLYPATYADIFIILPATADLIAKICWGIGDNVVTASALSLPPKCIRYFCPSMNLEMWDQKVVQENVSKLEGFGWRRIGPNEGHLACGATGEGRMAEPEEIISMVVRTFNNGDRFKGKKFLILSGPTLEHIDPVRFISNHSSGKMGKALAEAASHAGANVDFVTGPVSKDNLPKSSKINVVPVISAKEMLNTSMNLFPNAHAAIFTAAVSDFTPSHPFETKRPKSNKTFSLKLNCTPDIASTLCKAKNSGQVCIGFALETEEDAVSRAKKKLKKKALDAIVLNGLDSFNENDGDFCYISADPGKQIEKWGRITKSLLASRLIDKILEIHKFRSV